MACCCCFNYYGYVLTWQKGQSGNPAGRPKKGNTFSEVLEKEAQELLKSQGITMREALAKVLWRKAVMDKDLKAMDMIMDRIDGKAKSSLDVTTGGEPFQEIKQTVIDPRSTDT